MTTIYTKQACEECEVGSSMTDLDQGSSQNNVPHAFEEKVKDTPFNGQGAERPKSYANSLGGKIGSGIESV